MSVEPIRNDVPQRHISAWLRTVADKIDADESSGVVTMQIVHLDLAGDVYVLSYGKYALDKPHNLGMLQLATASILEGELRERQA